MKRRSSSDPTRAGRTRRAERRAKRPRRSEPPAADLRGRAESFLRKTPGDLARMPITDVQMLVHELQVHQIELEMQNEELRCAQLELSASRDRYTDLYEFAPVGYLTLERSGKIRQANLAATTLLGIERRLLIGKRFSSAVLPEAQNTWQRYFAAVRASPVKQSCELAMRKADGEPIWVALDIVSTAPERESIPTPWECRVVLVDVSERKRIEGALAESEMRRQLALAAGNVGEWIWNLRTDEVYYSPRWKAQLGYENRQLSNHLREWTKRLHPADRPGMLEVVRAYRENPWRAYEGEYRLRHRDGSYRWFLSRAGFRADESGAPLEMLGCQIDITARKRAEEELRSLNEMLEQRVAERTAELRASNERLEAEVGQRRKTESALRESEERLRAIVDTAVDAIVTIDASGVIRSVNPATERLFGYGAGEMIGNNVKMLMPSPYREEHDIYIQRYFETGERRIIGIGREMAGRHKDGSIFPVDLAVSESADEGPMFTGIVRDITERKNLQKALAESVAEEQQAIARELHDGVAQRLTGVEMMTSVLHARLQTESSPDTEGLGHLLAELRRAQEQLRGVIKGVYEHTVPADGLQAALDGLSRDTESLHGLRCIFESSGRIAVPNANTATQLYYVAREAVRNAVRHAGAKSVTIGLEADERRLLLTVWDDGKGIEPRNVRRGMGTQIMQYRAGLIGATLDIRPARNGGTVVVCLLRHGP
jgi:PAS domain S-box-containing protein